MKAECTNLLLLTISAFCNSSRWPLATKWAPCRRQRRIPLGGRYRQVSLYSKGFVEYELWIFHFLYMLLNWWSWVSTLSVLTQGYFWRAMIVTHDDVIKWKHFPRNWPFVRGIHRSPVNSPHKGQWRGALTFSLICVWINDGVNNREAGDLRRYCAHYDVSVMWRPVLCQTTIRTNASMLLIGPLGTNKWNMNQNKIIFIRENWNWNCRLQNGGRFVSASMCWYVEPRDIDIFHLGRVCLKLISTGVLREHQLQNMYRRRKKQQKQTKKPNAT